MAVLLERHGELAPYLAKYPSLFGFYDERRRKDALDVHPQRAENGVSFSHLGEDVLGASRQTCRLLPPIIFPALDISYDYTAKELPRHGGYIRPEHVHTGLENRENGANSTPLTQPSCNLSRRPATRICRNLPQITGSNKDQAIIDPREPSTSGLDRLLTQMAQAVHSYRELHASQTCPSSSAAARTLLTDLQMYTSAEAKDLLTAAPSSLQPCTHQIFPSVRPPTHPLAAHPTSSRPPPPATAAERAVENVLAYTTKIGVTERHRLDLAALMTAVRAVLHIIRTLQSATVAGDPAATVAATDEIAARILDFEGVAEDLRSLVVVLLLREMGLKSHQFTIVKKKLEAGGYSLGGGR